MINYKKDCLGKSYERTFVSNLGMLARKRLKIAAKNCFLFVSLCHLLLMDLGQDQQQHPTVHSGGNIRYVAVAVGDR